MARQPPRRPRRRPMAFETLKTPPSSAEGAAIVQPSASYSITMRVRLPQRPGAFAQVAAAIGDTGAILGAIDLVRVDRGTKLRDITVSCIDAAHGGRGVAAGRRPRRAAGGEGP